MGANDYQSRRDKILQAIIELYLHDPTPVSSRSVVDYARLNLSSATVRSVMAELEEIGMIKQPHTSAGRVPTDRGYKYYIGSIMKQKELNEQEKDIIDDMTSAWNRRAEKIVDPTLQILTSLTNCCGVVSFPRIEKVGFKRLELVSVSNNRLLAVLITTSGFLRDALIELDTPVSASELTRISNFLNSELSDLEFDDLDSFLLRKTLQIQDSFYFLFKEAIHIMEDMVRETKMKLVIEGVSKIISQPEFQDIEKGRVFLKALEQRKELNDIFINDIESGGISVHIGSEDPYSGFSNCSIVVCPYNVLGRSVGALGVIGPKRMDYAKAISIVDYVANKLSVFLDEEPMF